MLAQVLPIKWCTLVYMTAISDSKWTNFRRLFESGAWTSLHTGVPKNFGVSILWLQTRPWPKILLHAFIFNVYIPRAPKTVLTSSGHILEALGIVIKGCKIGQKIGTQSYFGPKSGLEFRDWGDLKISVVAYFTRVTPKELAHTFLAYSFPWNQVKFPWQSVTNYTDNITQMRCRVSYGPTPIIIILPHQNWYRRLTEFGQG